MKRSGRPAVRRRAASAGRLPRRRDAELARFLAEAVTGGRVTVAVALVGDGRSIRRWAAAGERRAGRAVAGDDLFDLASLTKPLAATLAVLLDRAGLLPLELQVGEVWPGAVPGLARRPLEALLRHRAGLVAWTPLYRRCRRPENVARLLTTDATLHGAPAGTYSDLGYVLWGLTAERVLNEDLAGIFRRHLLRPLGDERGIVERPGRGRRLVECRLGNDREIALAAAQGIRVAHLGAPPPGEPQDGNARFLRRRGSPGGARSRGGLAAHAGLFASVPALWRLGREWLAPGGLLEPAEVDRALAGGGPFGLGWARRRVRGGAGRALSPRAFGHTGFTGGSFWVDPERGRIYVLLAHRCAVAPGMEAWQRRFHAIAAGEGGGRA